MYGPLHLIGSNLLNLAKLKLKGYPVYYTNKTDGINSRIIIKKSGDVLIKTGFLNNKPEKIHNIYESSDRNGLLNYKTNPLKNIILDCIIYTEYIHDCKEEISFYYAYDIKVNQFVQKSDGICLKSIFSKNDYRERMTFLYMILNTLKLHLPEINYKSYYKNFSHCINDEHIIIGITGIREVHSIKTHKELQLEVKPYVSYERMVRGIKKANVVIPNDGIIIYCDKLVFKYKYREDLSLDLNYNLISHKLFTSDGIYFGKLRGIDINAIKKKRNELKCYLGKKFKYKDENIIVEVNAYSYCISMNTIPNNDWEHRKIRYYKKKANSIKNINKIYNVVQTPSLLKLDKKQLDIYLKFGFKLKLNHYNTYQYYKNNLLNFIKKIYNMNNCLDIGCGKGNDIYWYILNKIENVTFIDKNKKEINIMKKKILKNNIIDNVHNYKTKLVDVTEKNSFYLLNNYDVITCFNSVRIYNKYFFENIKKWLSTNGIFIMLYLDSQLLGNDNEYINNFCNTKYFNVISTKDHYEINRGKLKEKELKKNSLDIIKEFKLNGFKLIFSKQLTEINSETIYIIRSVTNDLNNITMLSSYKVLFFKKEDIQNKYKKNIIVEKIINSSLKEYLKEFLNIKDIENFNYVFENADYYNRYHSHNININECTNEKIQLNYITGKYQHYFTESELDNDSDNDSDYDNDSEYTDSDNSY